jgi:hypothetical protein
MVGGFHIFNTHARILKDSWLTQVEVRSLLLILHLYFFSYPGIVIKKRHSRIICTDALAKSLSAHFTIQVRSCTVLPSLACYLKIGFQIY